MPPLTAVVRRGSSPPPAEQAQRKPGSRKFGKFRQIVNFCPRGRVPTQEAGRIPRPGLRVLAGAAGNRGPGFAGSIESEGWLRRDAHEAATPVV